MKDEILHINNISKIFHLKKDLKVEALDKINFKLYSGESLGIVGESGSGKSTLARIIAGIEKYSDGEIIFNGKVKKSLSINKDIQMIFQNPLSSFDTRMKIFDYMWEPLRNFLKISKVEALSIAKKSLFDVGLDEEVLNRYPHELSGGQLQRIAIARVIQIKPKVIICDEITSALDVTIQKQILELLKELQQKFNLSYLFIGHDLAVVQNISHRIIVMNKGKIVDEVMSNKLKDSKNSYTRELLESILELKL